ncbi:ARM repeat-containing protein [Gigaspora margarita]|uniref:ARM repeat-containing protein n=2 Tax=Gigaspora margarita TaxID=4874 RepID=A0A8H4APY2_GIGMA|nr:ARM repeat-containing protein [Gigaspora margarita]
MATDTTETFLVEVNALFTSQDKARREQADIWLQAFQKTSEAWALSDQILRSQIIPETARYFAARTFRQKITLDLHQLDSAARISLRDSLLELLYQYREGPRKIITQICLSLVALALQMPEWQNVLPQFAELYGKNPDTVKCLLEFLKILPEEVNTNNRIPISDEDYRIRSKELLTNNANEVLQMLLIYLQNSGENIDYQIQVFECFESWLYSGDIAIASLENNPFLGHSFDALQSNELYDIAVDVVCRIIHETRDTSDSMRVIEQIYPRLLPLRESLKRAIEEEDDDKVRGYCRIFTQAGESYLELIVQHADAFQSIVESIAECAAYHDTEIVRITFAFWHRLADTLCEPRHADIRERFKTIYLNLVDVMIKHLHYPNDLSSWTAERRDEFREFRHVMGDVLKDCCLIAGSQECLTKPYTTLAHQLLNPANGNMLEWQQIEAPLFSLRAMGSEIPEEENVVLPQIMQLLQQLPDHPKIRYAATLVISRYSFWTRKHSQFIPYQLNFISSGFDNEEVAAAASMALKYLCKDCSELLVEYLPQLHPFYLNVTNKLNGADLLEVTEAVTHVVAAVPPAEILKALQTFCLPIAQGLHLLANKGVGANERDIRNACDKLEQFSMILRVFAERQKKDDATDVISLPVHPCISIIQELWPVFDLLLMNFGADSHLSESLCKCFKYCIVYYPAAFRPLLPEFMDRLITVFDRTSLSCYLWVAGKCVREHSTGEGTEATLTLLTFFERLSVTMFRFIVEKKPSDIPDVVEDYFRLNITFIDCAPLTYSQSAIFPSVLQAGLTSLAIEQQDALHSVLAFFNKLLSFIVKEMQQIPPASGNITGSPITPPSHPVGLNSNLLNLGTILCQHGSALIDGLFRGLMYTFSRDLQQNYVEDILTSLAKLYPHDSQQWISEVFQHLQDANLTSDIKNAFIRDYNLAIQSQDLPKLRRVTNDFVAIFRRRYLGTV